MIIPVDTDHLEQILSEVVEAIDYDVWKELFFYIEDNDREDLNDLIDVFRNALLKAQNLE